MKITVEQFGTMPDGKEALLYVLENDNKMRVEITNLGGVVRSIFVPDKDGKLADVVLGHASFADYLRNPPYLGALVGRNSNRIAGAKLEIGDKTYEVDKNDGENNLHGGKNGLTFQLLSGEVRTFNNMPALVLSHTVEDMSDGFPGNLTVTVAYALTNDNALMIDYRAVSDADTIINLTNHSYFNLGGHDSGTIHDHVLQMDASFYSPNTPDGIPDGETLRVEGTPFDFRAGKAIGEEIGSDYGQVKLFGGYDHNFLLNGSGYRKIATVTHPGSGRVMNVFSDLPCVQLYTSNMLAEGSYKDGAHYAIHQALCLETQVIPNAAQMPWVASPIYRAGEEYTTTTTYQFSVK